MQFIELYYRKVFFSDISFTQRFLQMIFFCVFLCISLCFYGILSLVFMARLSFIAKGKFWVFIHSKCIVFVVVYRIYKHTDWGFSENFISFLPLKLSLGGSNVCKIFSFGNSILGILHGDLIWMVEMIAEMFLHRI